MIPLPLVDPNFRPAWQDMPSPKPTSADRSALRPWADAYTTFSLAFANEAVQKLTSPRDARPLVDPFVGTGTTLVAACMAGAPAIGIDLDPMSCIISRARVATTVDRQFFRSVLQYAESRSVLEEANADLADLFDPSDYTFISGVIDAIERESGLRGRRLFETILDDASGVWDTAAVVLCALVLGANRSGRLQRGSNPVWFRRPVPGEAVCKAPVAQQAIEAFEFLERLVERNRISFRSRDIHVRCGDATSPDIYRGAIASVLTSPPYLNRLDYVVRHLPGISALSRLTNLKPDHLRRHMIGTTKIIAKTDDGELAGSLAEHLLRRIANHSSKASASYYYWNVRQYFTKMMQVFRLTKDAASPSATFALVVQSSYYKDIPLPVPEILADLAGKAGFSVEFVRAQAVRSHMGRMSPLQKGYVPSKILWEKVLLLRRC